MDNTEFKNGDEEDQIVGRLVKIMVPASTVVCATR